MPVFFFYARRDLRDLHSFPTRRSSDLRLDLFASTYLSTDQCHTEIMHGRVRPDARPDHRDRKSTRLNSSHSSISYAVFCLKKKNKQTRYLSPTLPENCAQTSL